MKRTHEIYQGNDKEVTEFLDKYSGLMDDFKIHHFERLDLEDGVEFITLVSWISPQ